MSARKKLRKFIDAVRDAPAGTDFEVGLTWHPVRRWMVYQRIGSHLLAMSPDGARKMLATFERVAKQSQWKDVAKGELSDTYRALKELADEADQKNAKREVPAEAAAFMPAEGSA